MSKSLITCLAHLNTTDHTVQLRCSNYRVKYPWRPFYNCTPTNNVCPLIHNAPLHLSLQMNWRTSAVSTKRSPTRWIKQWPTSLDINKGRRALSTLWNDTATTLKTNTFTTHIVHKQFISIIIKKRVVEKAFLSGMKKNCLISLFTHITA